jgi:hypothetical protein
MLKSLTHWLFGPPAPDEKAALQAWCESSGWSMRGIREQAGFVIDTGLEGLEGRIEWGPSQRRYLGDHELRLRGDIGLAPAAHALVMPRGLLATLEHTLYNQFIDGVQTRLDEETPEEMRWLALSPKLGSDLLGELKPHYAGVSNVTPWLAHWLRGPLGEMLQRRAEGPADEAPPFALIVQRGRLTLRVALAEPKVGAVKAAQTLFSMALAQARFAAEAQRES